MHEFTAAFVGAAIRAEGWTDLRRGWNDRLGVAQDDFSPEVERASCEDVLRSALEEAGCWGPERPVHNLAVILVGGPSTPVLDLPVAGAFHGEEALSRAVLLGQELLRDPKVDAVAFLCRTDLDNQAVAFVLRRFWEAWRAELPCYAVLADPGLGPLPQIGQQVCLQKVHDLPSLNGACWLNRVDGSVSHEVEQGRLFLEVLLSLHDRLLPPTKHFSPEEAPFFTLETARPWFHGNDLQSRFALWSDGEIDIVLTEPIEREFGSSRRRRRRLADRWAYEVFLWKAPSRTAMLERVEAAALAIENYGHLSDLACAVAEEGEGNHRLAIVASDRQSLRKGLETVTRRLADPECSRLALASGVFYQEVTESPPPFAMLFPGQGSQYSNMVVDLCLALPTFQAWFDRFDEESDANRPPPSEFLFPIPGAHRQDDAHQLLMGEEGAEGSSVCAIGFHELWERLGLKPDVIAGYSIGELSALISAQVFQLKRGDLVRLMSELTRERTPGGIGSFPSIAVTAIDRVVLDRVIEEGQGEIFLALDSCPNQAVLSGLLEPMRVAEKALREAGSTVLPLRFDRGYHTPLYARKSAKIRQLYEQVPVGPGTVPVFSCISLDWFPREAEAIRDLAVSQWVNPVRFREAIGKLHDSGVSTFLEVGPGSRLTGFVRDTLRGRSFKALSSDAQDRSGLRQFLLSYAQLFVSGHPLDHRPLFQEREVLWPEPVEFIEHSDSSAKPSTNEDVLLTLLRSHMGLMEEFLGHQGRIHDLLNGRPSKSTPQTSPPPVLKNRLATATALLGEPFESDATSARWRLSFTSESLPLLSHHTLGGRPSERDASLTPLPVLPFAFATELMGQAALKLAGSRGETLQELREIRGLRWLAVDGSTLDLELRARQETSGAVALELYECGPSETVIAYTAQAFVGPTFEAVPEPILIDFKKTRDFTVSGAAFYSFVFHGPAFQGIRQLTGIGAMGAEAEMVVASGTGLLPLGVPMDFLSNPVLQDCAGQLVGFWLLEQHGLVDIGLYPYRLGKLCRYGASPGPGAQVICRASVDFDGRRTKADLDLMENERVFARIEGFESRLFRFPPPVFQTIFAMKHSTYMSVERSLPQGMRINVLDGFSPELFDSSWGIWRRALAQVILTASERRAWLEVPPELATPWLLRRLVLKEALRRWSAGRGARLLPADIDCGGDGLTPTGLTMELLGSLPRLGVVGEGTFAVAILVPPNRKLGVALAEDDLDDAARAAVANLDRSAVSPWQVSRDADTNEILTVWRGGEEIAVNFHREGDRTVAWCIAPINQREGESDETRPERDRESHSRDCDRDDRRLGSRA